MDLLVAEKLPGAADVVTVTLRRADGGRLPDWTPGAHVDLLLPNGMTRQYSLCGDRWDAYSYRVGVLRERDGRGGSAYVHDSLAVGSVVAVGGPRNNFPLVPAARYLFVAGGIGVTPLLPMITQAAMVGADWRLLYGGRSLPFLPELPSAGVTVGRPDLSLLSYRPDTKVYVCGPAALLADVERRCADWPAGALRTERFVPKDVGPVRDEPFEVTLRRSGRRLIVPPGQSILDAMAGAGVPVLSSCRQGTCGTCETAVLAGEPDHRDSILDDTERAAGECMFVCVSRAHTERLVLDL